MMTRLCYHLPAGARAPVGGLCYRFCPHFVPPHALSCTRARGGYDVATAERHGIVELDDNDDEYCIADRDDTEDGVDDAQQPEPR